MNITTNPAQRLYLIPCGEGFTTYGFDVVERLIAHLHMERITTATETTSVPGTPERYHYFRALCREGEARHKLTGWRSTAELTPELVRYEGMRVEVTHRWNRDAEPEKVRFNVGKSTGWMPCHIQLANRASRGGIAVALGEILHIRTV